MLQRGTAGIACHQADDGREIAAGGIAGDGEACGIDAEFDCVCRNPAQRIEGIDLKTYEMPVDQFNALLNP